jgi:predicted GNAT family acetyltransferase
MTRERADRISVDDAARRVGQTMFADQWINTLTPRETWLIERYVEGRGGSDEPMSILPGLTSYVGGWRSWSERPSDPALVAEVERARDKRDWCEAQWAQAFEWLEGHGFADDIDEDALEEAIAKQWVTEPDVRFRRDDVLRDEGASGGKAAAIEVVAAEASPLTTAEPFSAKCKLEDRLADELSKSIPMEGRR